MRRQGASSRGVVEDYRRNHKGDSAGKNTTPKKILTCKISKVKWRRRHRQKGESSGKKSKLSFSSSEWKNERLVKLTSSDVSDTTTFESSTPSACSETKLLRLFL
ncbi:hypothetical protein LXL04_038478 [Taraxacum kok-saghyz]